MNLLLRLAWTWLARRWRAPVSTLGPCVTPFRVLPTDLDLLMHVNNGVYLSLMDVARMDLMYRADLVEKISARRWYPVVVAETIQFRRSLHLLDRLTITTTVAGWDEKAMLLEQQFVRGSEVIASAIVRSQFLVRGGGAVDPSELAVLAGLPAQSPVLPEHVALWNASQIR